MDIKIQKFQKQKQSPINWASWEKEDTLASSKQILLMIKIIWLE